MNILSDRRLAHENMCVRSKRPGLAAQVALLLLAAAQAALVAGENCCK